MLIIHVCLVSARIFSEVKSSDHDLILQEFQRWRMNEWRKKKDHFLVFYVH